MERPLNVADLPKEVGRKPIGISGSRHLALWVLALLWIPGAGVAQEQGAPASEGEVEAPEDQDEAETEEEEEAEADPKSTDPRILAREEQERRARINQLSRRPSTLPTEGRALTSANVPLGLQSRQGIQYGKTIISPSAFVGAVYSDNANSEEDDRRDEVTLGGSASLRADALLRRHALGAEVNVTAGTALKGEDDDVFGWQIGADGRYDLTRQSSINGAVSGRLAQEAESSNEADDNDAEVNDYSVGIGYQQIGRRLGYSLNTSLDRSDFSGDNTADRDRSTYNFSGQVIRTVSDRLAVFVAPQYSINAFDEASDEDGINRDSSELSAVVGADYQPRPRLTLGASLGYSRTFFNASDVDDEDAIIGTLSAGYAYDARTDANLTLSRQADVTTTDNAASETTTTATAGVTRLLSSTQAVTTNASYVYSDFDGTDRVDHDLSAGISYFHQLNTNMALSVGYQFSTRFSDIDNNDFYENQISVGLSMAY